MRTRAAAPPIVSKRWILRSDPHQPNTTAAPELDAADLIPFELVFDALDDSDCVGVCNCKALVF